MDGAPSTVVGHVPSRSHPCSQYPFERMIEDLPLARLNWPKIPLQDLAAQMSSEDYTKVYQFVETTPQLEDRLELLAGLPDEEQRITTAANEDMIQKYKKGLRLKNFQVGDGIVMKTQKKGPKKGRRDGRRDRSSCPHGSAHGVITWVGNRGAAKVETPKGGMKIYNLDSLKLYFGPIKKID